MKILNMALSFGDMPDITASEWDYSSLYSGVGPSTTLKAETKNEFYLLVKEARIVAIDSDLILKLTDDSLQTNVLTGVTAPRDRETFDLPVCPPFKCQWVELCGSNRNSMLPSVKVNGITMSVLGMLINEISPGTYDIYTYESQEAGGTVTHKFAVTRNVPSKVDPVRRNNIQTWLAVWMRAINSGAIGVEYANDVVMLPKENGKKPGKTKPHEIRRIVRIVPKKLKDKIEPLTPGGKIDFSHQWEVRGHWRRVAGIGKDRDGNYGVHGLTWVTSCVKGPETMPLITKTRWVTGSKTA